MGAPPGAFSMRDIREHAARRKLLAGAFGKSELRGTLEGVVRGKVRLAVQKMKVEMERDTDGQREAGRCDVLKWWMFLATDVAGHLIFGEDFGMVELGVVCFLVLLLVLVCLEVSELTGVEKRIYPFPRIDYERLWNLRRTPAGRVHSPPHPHCFLESRIPGE